MVKILDYGDQLKRPKTYYKAKCNHCNAELVFEYGDIWFEDALNGVGRVECPVCRTKLFFNTERLYMPRVVDLKDARMSEYENAYTDASKRGIAKLMEEKKKEDISNEDNNG